jgi:hypothetical protein
MPASILSEPLKNSELVTISLWVFATVGSAFMVLFTLIGFFAKRYFDNLVEGTKASDKALQDSLLEMSKTIKEGFSEAFGRIKVLERFKAHIEVLHPMNHPNQDFHD